MKRMITTLVALAGAVALQPAASAQTVAIVHAKAWTMLGPTSVPDATILVSNGRIVSVVSGGPVSPGATVIDAKGQPVTPGLTNAATQVGLLEVSSASDTHDASAKGEAIGPSFDVSYALNGNSAIVDLARADGMTRALSYPGNSGVAPFAGQAAMIRLREGADILDRATAAMFVTIGGGAWDSAAGSRAAQWQLLRAALDEAKAPQPPLAGGEKPLLNRRDVAAVRRVLAGAMPLAIVTHRESDIRQAIRLAADYRVKVVVVGGAEAWRVAGRLAAAHIPVVLDPQSNLPTTFDQLGSRQDSAAILSKAGVKLGFGLAGGAIGLTYNAGLALREGAGIAVANGLPYAAALRAITVDAASIWGGRSGTLAAGSDADIVIWNGDPLEPSTTAAAMLIEGKPVSLMTRQGELVRRYLPASQEKP